MHIKLVSRDTEGELLLEGRLDANSAPETEKILKQMVEKYSTLVLNMKDLDYISSAGLRVLKSTHIAMRQKGGSLKLKNVNEMVMEVFEMTGFSALLKIEQ